MKSLSAKMPGRLMTLALIALFFSWPAQAMDVNASDSAEPLPQDSVSDERIFSFDLKFKPQRERNTFWPPLVSFLLPGFDQWTEGQYPSAALYSGSAIAGSALAASSLERIGKRDLTDLSSRDDDVRSYMLGSQIWMSAGSFSAYHSFRSAAQIRKRNQTGYEFLPDHETTDQLLLAPFEFHWLKEPSTYIPLGGLFVLMVAEFSSEREILNRNSFRIADAGFAGAFSYLAGTNEEALFRGWLMPITMQRWQSPFWSNSLTALLFSLAHLSDHNRAPLPQLALGWYLGHRAQQNQWSLKESIFIHTWWDVIAFTGTYLYESRDKRRATYFYLPLLSGEF